MDGRVLQGFLAMASRSRKEAYHILSSIGPDRHHVLYPVHVPLVPSALLKSGVMTPARLQTIDLRCLDTASGPSVLLIRKCIIMSSVHKDGPDIDEEVEHYRL